MSPLLRNSTLETVFRPFPMDMSHHVAHERSRSHLRLYTGSDILFPYRSPSPRPQFLAVIIRQKPEQDVGNCCKMSCARSLNKKTKEQEDQVEQEERNHIIWQTRRKEQEKKNKMTTRRKTHALKYPVPYSSL